MPCFRICKRSLSQDLHRLDSPSENLGCRPNSLTGLTVKVLTDNPATPEDESLGCSVAAYGSLPPNTLAVANRGVCARVAKAIFGQQAGAAVVVMVNNANSLPPFEGKITSNPDDGTPFKSFYDPRKWLRAAELGMVERIGEAFADLGSAGRSIAAS